MRHHYHFSVPEEKRVRLIIDTDAKNEADDQFAIVQAILTPKFKLEGIVAAHFGSGFMAQNGGKPVEHSMQASYDEVVKILELMDMGDEIPVYKGCEAPLSGGEHNVEGVDFIIERALAEDSTLYLIALGPLTNVAAALTKEPKIENRIHVIWIGGGTYPHGENEFNLSNDIEAANLLFSSNTPVWQLTKKAYYGMKISLAELEDKVRPCGKLGEYLCDQMIALNDATGWLATWPHGESWNICDMAAVGLLIDEHEYYYDLTPAPFITSDMHYILQANRRAIRVYETVDSRFIFEDFFAKLRLYHRSQQEIK